MSKKIENFSKKNYFFQGKVVVHGVPPYALAWTSSHIAVAGCDKVSINV